MTRLISWSAILSITILGIWLFPSCSFLEEEATFPYDFNLIHIKSEASFRGISAVNDSVCWISGTQGTVLRTINGGQSWDIIQLPNNDSVDLRDIHAFDDQTAITMAIGSPAKIFKTSNGGKTWHMTYFNDHADIFLDGIAFFDDQNGMVFGDAIDKRIVILTTSDAGDHWEIPANEQLPQALDEEGGFAASGTSIITHGTEEVYIGLGQPKGRLIYSHDRGKKWDFYLTGLGNGDDSRGVYSIDFNDNGYGVVVGGDWRDPDNQHLVAATSHDKGLHWEIVTEEPPGGYRSAVQFIPNSNFVLCTGPNGTDYSSDLGLTWKTAETGGANTISFSPDGGTGFMAGNKGRVIVLRKTVQAN